MKKYLRVHHLVVQSLTDRHGDSQRQIFMFSTLNILANDTVTLSVESKAQPLEACLYTCYGVQLLVGRARKMKAGKLFVRL